MAVLDPSLKVKNPRLEPKNGQHVIKIKDLIKATKSKRKALKKNFKELVVPGADKLRRIILLTNTMSRFCRKKVKNPQPPPRKSQFGDQKLTINIKRRAKI